ncbi:MAG: HEAT repeat domain-containing protein [Candidatus Micrarchaeia archaeon]
MPLLRVSPIGERERRLREEITASGVKPRLTFLFPLSRDRQSALDLLTAETPNLETAQRLINESSDPHVLAAALLIHPKEEASLKKIKQLLEHPDWRVQQAAGQAIANHSKTTKKELNELLENPIEDVQVAAAQAIANHPETTRQELKKLLKHPYWQVQRAAGQAIANNPETTRQELEKLLEHPNGWVQRAAAQTLGNYPETTKQELEKVLKHPYWWMQQVAAQAIANHPETTRQELEKLLEHPIGGVQVAAAEAIANHPETTRQELEKLLEHSHGWVRRAAAQTLGNYPETTRQELEKLLEHSDWWVRRAARLTIMKRFGDSRPLYSRKTLFATGYPKELLTRLKKLDGIVRQLKVKYGDDFTGVTVFGSTSKGYVTPESDLDYAVIARNPKALEKFKKRAENLKLKLCHEYYVHPEETGEPANALFRGLFIGDHKQLRQAQRKIIQRISQPEWNRIVNRIRETEKNLGKADQRFGLTREESLKLQLAAELARVPPEDIEEMRRLMKARKAA